MSVTITIRSASDEQIAALSRDADALDKYLNTISDAKAQRLITVAGDNQHPMIQEMVRNLESRRPAAGEEVIDVELEKMWMGLHYLLTGQVIPTASPLSVILNSDNPMKSHKVGTANAIGSERLALVQQALELLDESMLFSRLDSEKMEAAGVYPQGYWAACDGDFSHLSDVFRAFKKFLADAKERGEGMIVWSI